MLFSMAHYHVNMFADPWPEEPADPFPEYSEPDLEELSDSSDPPASSEVPPDIQRGVWGLVAVFRIGLFALALGPMMMLFRGEWNYGGLIAGIGVVTCAYGVHRYFVYQRLLPEA